MYVRGARDPTEVAPTHRASEIVHENRSPSALLERRESELPILYCDLSMPCCHTMLRRRKTGGALILHPQNVWPLWPGCALLVSVLLLAPRRTWPILIAAGFAAFALYDLQSGVPIGSVVRLLLADTVEVLTAALLVSYSFDGVPRLDSVKALAKYSLFAVILAPCAVSFLGALAWRGNYWIGWRVSLFSEAIAFLTLTPAILGWASIGPAWAQKSRAYYLEAAALIVTLVLVGYFILLPREIAPHQHSFIL